MKLREKILDYLALLSLLLAGIFGILIGLGLQPAFLPRGNILQTILVILSLLCLGVGLERVTLFRRYDQHVKNYDKHLERYEQQISRFEHTLLRSLSGQHLRGSEEIYDSAIRYVSTANNRIRTIVFGRSSKAPQKWAEAVARRLKEMKLAGTPIKFEVVIAVDFQQLPSDFQEGIDTRFKIYERHGVKELVSLYLLDIKPAIGFDILIIDREHVILSLTTLAGITVLQSAVAFENQPKFTSEFVDWFDQFILRSALPYETWTKTAYRQV